MGMDEDNQDGHEKLEFAPYTALKYNIDIIRILTLSRINVFYTF